MIDARSQLLNRNDHILLTVFVASLIVISLVSVLPANDAWALLNSSFFLSFISASAGAFAGAWAAQVIADRTAQRKLLLDQIHATNSAIGLGFGIMNTYCSLKRQHVRVLSQEYAAALVRRNAHDARRRSGEIPPNTPFEFQMNLKTISVPFSPIESLHDVVLKNIGPPTKIIILLTPLIQSSQGLEQSIDLRNRWIDEVRGNPTLDEQKKAAMYFGTPDQKGHIDERYSNSITAITDATDDCIAYSKLITDALVAYGESLSVKFNAGAFSAIAPRISKPSWKRAEEEGLIPDMAQYAEWAS